MAVRGGKAYGQGAMRANPNAPAVNVTGGRGGGRAGRGGRAAAAAAGGAATGVRGAKGGKNVVRTTLGGKQKNRGAGGGGLAQGSRILRGGAAGGNRAPRGGARPAANRRGQAARARELGNMLAPRVRGGKRAPAPFTVG
jgi:hypothetical protein